MRALRREWRGRARPLWGPAWCSSCAALVVRKTGTRWIDRLIPTVVMAEIIFVIGCGLATTAVSEALTVPEGETLWQTLVVAGVAFFVVVLCTCFGKRVLNTIPVLAGAAVAYGLSCAFGMVDFTPVAEAAWIGLPEFTLPVVDVTAIVLVSPIAIIVVIEHIGHLFVIGEMTHRNYNPILWRSLFGGRAWPPLSPAFWGHLRRRPSLRTSACST